MSDAIDEVVRQHVFIEAWLAGTTNDDDEWQQFADVLDDRFEIVPPSGVAEPKATLLERFHPANGVMPGVRLEIRNGVSIHRTADVEVVRYEEWQIHPERGNQRVSTAVFVANADAPLGWSWLTLHETAVGLLKPG